jgi:hypothetical protein
VSNSDNRPYSTEQEIQYIDELAAGLLSRTLTPEQMLLNYIVNAKRRQQNNTFGSVDANQVIEYAKMKLVEVSRE